MADIRIFLTTTGLGTWIVPDDCQEATIECIGGGGGGSTYSSSSYCAGGGGAYSKKNNVSLTPGASLAFSVGAGGASGPGDNPTDGGDSWFGNSVYASALCAAKGGIGGRYNLGKGGAAASGIGDVKFSGGNGGDRGGYSYGGGGGGAAGPNGNGVNGENAKSGNEPGAGGAGGAGYGGAGDPGSTVYYTDHYGGAGTEWDATHGSGGGGGGGWNKYCPNGYGGMYGGGAGQAGGGSYDRPGAQGIIVITYTPVATGSSKFFQLFN